MLRPSNVLHGVAETPVIRENSVQGGGTTRPQKVHFAQNQNDQLATDWARISGPISQDEPSAAQTSLLEKFQEAVAPYSVALQPVGPLALVKQVVGDEFFSPPTFVREDGVELTGVPALVANLRQTGQDFFQMTGHDYSRVDPELQHPTETRQALAELLSPEALAGAMVMLGTRRTARPSGSPLDGILSAAAGGTADSSVPKSPRVRKAQIKDLEAQHAQALAELKRLQSPRQMTDLVTETQGADEARTKEVLENIARIEQEFHSLSASRPATKRKKTAPELRQDLVALKEYKQVLTNRYQTIGQSVGVFTLAQLSSSSPIPPADINVQTQLRRASAEVEQRIVEVDNQIKALEKKLAAANRTTARRK